ncbi:MAG: hypothetical protein JNN22_11895 [Rhodospirillales bacterium]|nr:hypothetical protein [Rhodospirillales bacterium]
MTAAIFGGLMLATILQMALSRRIDALLAGRTFTAFLLAVSSIAVVAAAGYVAALEGWQTLAVGTAALTAGRLFGCMRSVSSGGRAQ